MSLSDRYTQLSREVAAGGARLVAVSKTHPEEVIQQLYELGHRDFGENRVGELVRKHAALPKDINWHLIGHLQRNKARDVVDIVSLIHSGDSLRLLRELDKRISDRRVDVLLQYHIAQEENKYGLTRDTGRELMDSIGKTPLHHLRIIGVMGMATYTDDQEQVAREFRELHELFAELKSDYFADDASFTEISMGMSGDYPTALQQGSTMVRVGSKLFGERE